jgi:cell division septation protein DedD
LKSAPAPAAMPAVANSKTPAKTASYSSTSKSASASPVSSGMYTVQVAALRRESDAQAVAANLQKKKFAAFVVAPQTDKYYHVQVGPFPDLKSAEASKKGLETAGFKAIVKH